ncbi:hypothetical protein K439DRAFT_1621036 [Ramaria rubella]|nr:hypothetical protein K439DRAFT_1621036 [Ramaria rubella]
MSSAISKDPTVLTSILNPKSQVINYSTLPLLYTIYKVSKNPHLLNPDDIPNPILQMAQGKVYIPLSMLTTASLNHIRNNDNLKYIKVTNGIICQTLDPLQFGSEEHLTSDNWAQAYKNWLTLIDAISEPGIGVGWHKHYSKMCLDQNFSCWFPAWRDHNKRIRSQFTSKPFLIDPLSITYTQGFEQARVDLLANSQSIPSSSSSHSFCQDYHYNNHSDNHSFHGENCPFSAHIHLHPAVPFGPFVMPQRHYASAVVPLATKLPTAPLPHPIVQNTPSSLNGSKNTPSQTLAKNYASGSMCVAVATTITPFIPTTLAPYVEMPPMAPPLA